MTGPAEKFDPKEVAKGQDTQPEQLRLNPADYQAFITASNPGLDPGLTNQTFGHPSSFINASTFTPQAIQQTAMNPKEAAALAHLGTMAALDVLTGGPSAAPSDKQQDPCSAAQSEAGAVASKSVVTTDDVAKLKALSSQVGPGFTERQWAAQGALSSAIGIAEGKLGASDLARTDGSGTNADWAQSFPTADAYRAYIERQKQGSPQDSQQA